ncbi:MAG: TIGR01212 family radical SAM protein [Agathobacter sp.]|nr:TIGR01212 family radical SAM protein [Agathobacter sp.]MDY4892697.1 TIGR01212 family radical SAM protein [Agathobacter sp.]
MPQTNRYYSLNDFCQETFGEKVYRLSLSGGMTCPNRDGTLAYGGCAFCSEGGSGDFAADAVLPVSEQIQQAKTLIQKKTACKKFIAYFQSFTNTYASVQRLQQLFTEAMEPDEIVALSVGTRSDCLPDPVLSLLASLNQKKPVWIELGLQSIHERTLIQMNTHTTVNQFDAAVYALSARGISVVVHVILGFPGETPDMMKETIRHIAALPISGVKLQLLHVLQGTALADTYEKNPFPIMSLEEYCDLVIDCLELLPPNMVIHRLTGDGPRKLLIAPSWSTDKKRILNTIHHRMKERNTRQGELFHG